MDPSTERQRKACKTSETSLGRTVSNLSGIRSNSNLTLANPGVENAQPDHPVTATEKSVSAPAEGGDYRTQYIWLHERRVRDAAILRARQQQSSTAPPVQYSTGQTQVQMPFRARSRHPGPPSGMQGGSILAAGGSPFPREPATAATHQDIMAAIARMNQRLSTSVTRGGLQSGMLGARGVVHQLRPRINDAQFMVSMLEFPEPRVHGLPYESTEDSDR
ncbi:hypothetical protein ACN47E_007983 [Coniothyrium glycines]